MAEFRVRRYGGCDLPRVDLDDIVPKRQMRSAGRILEGTFYRFVTVGWGSRYIKLPDILPPELRAPFPDLNTMLGVAKHEFDLVGTPHCNPIWHVCFPEEGDFARRPDLRQAYNLQLGTFGRPASHLLPKGGLPVAKVDHVPHIIGGSTLDRMAYKILRDQVCLPLL